MEDIQETGFMLSRVPIDGFVWLNVTGAVEEEVDPAVLDGDKTAQLISVLTPNIIALCVAPLLFSCLRTRFRRVFEPLTLEEYRKDVPGHDGPWPDNNEVKSPGPKLWDWFMPAIKYPIHELMGSHGLEAAVIVLFLQNALLLFTFITVTYGLFVLIPLVATGRGPSDDAGPYVQVLAISLSNVRNGSWRLWGFVIGLHYYSYVAFYFFYRMYRTYAELRVHYLKRHTSANYTVMALDLPPGTTDATLRARFEKLYPNEVVDARVAVHVPALIKGRNELEKCTLKLEKAEAKFKSKGERPTMRDGKFGLCGSKVDAIDHLKAEKERLEKEVLEMMADPQKALGSSAFAKIGGAAVAQAKGVANKGKGLVKKSDEDGEEEAADGASTPAFTGHLTRVGFITFKSIRRAAQVSQLLIERDSHQTVMRVAESPEDIIWRQLHIVTSQRNVRRALIGAASVALMIYWSVLTAIVSGLGNLGELRKLPGFGPVIDAIPDALRAIITGFLPTILLIVLMAILPIILRKFALIQGRRTYTRLDRSTLDKYFLFLFVTVFLAATIGGTATALIGSASEIAENPASIFNILGTAIPKQAFFFLFYLIQAGMTQLTLSMCRLGPLIVCNIKAVALAKTPRGAKAAFNPGPYNSAKMLGLFLLAFLISMSFSLIAPIVLPFAVLYWFIAFLATKYQLLYVHIPVAQGGGILFPHLFQRIFAALIIFQVTLCGVMIAKAGALQTPFCLAILPMSILFYKYTLSSFAAPSTNLNEEDAQHTEERGLNGEEFFGAYTHPAYKPISLGWEIPLERVPITPFDADAYEARQVSLKSVGKGISKGFKGLSPRKGKKKSEEEAADTDAGDADSDVEALEVKSAKRDTPDTLAEERRESGGPELKRTLSPAYNNTDVELIDVAEKIEEAPKRRRSSDGGKRRKSRSSMNK